jgi:hypothetical protein
MPKAGCAAYRADALSMMPKSTKRFSGNIML